MLILCVPPSQPPNFYLTCKPLIFNQSSPFRSTSCPLQGGLRIPRIIRKHTNLMPQGCRRPHVKPAPSERRGRDTRSPSTPHTPIFFFRGKMLGHVWEMLLALWCSGRHVYAENVLLWIKVNKTKPDPQN